MAHDKSTCSPFYVDYGKVFYEGQPKISDFLVLDRWDGETGRYIQDFSAALAFPGKALSSPFTTRGEENGVGNVSVALVPIFKGYLYVQIQRRREGEKEEGTPNRAYNQVRYVYLEQEDILEHFSASRGLFSGLLYSNSPGSYRLKDYLFPDFGAVREWKVDLKENSWSVVDRDLLRGIVDALYASRHAHNATDSSNNPQLPGTVVVLRSGMPFNTWCTPRWAPLHLHLTLSQPTTT
jgi:hypothetical protein